MSVFCRLVSAPLGFVLFLILLPHIVTCYNLYSIVFFTGERPPRFPQWEASETLPAHTDRLRHRKTCSEATQLVKERQERGASSCSPALSQKQPLS